MAQTATVRGFIVPFLRAALLSFHTLARPNGYRWCGWSHGYNPLN